MRLLPALLLLSISLGGCKPATPTTQEKAAAPAPDPAPASASAPASPARVQTLASRVPAALVEPISEEMARDLFSGWLAAQNNGTFPAYAALYADKMEGIKRSGPRTRRYGRGGWLADRESMFKKKMTVKADDVRLTVARNTATVLFTQTWASGTYKDVGPKQLVLVKAAPDKALRIVREEMLSSEIQGVVQEGMGAALTQVVTVEGKAFLVLDVTPRAFEGASAPRLISQGDPVVLAMDLKAASVPEPWRTQASKPLQLYGLSGKVCQARITGFALLGRITPHFGTRQQWEAKERTPREREARMAREAWALTSGQTGGRGRLLVGALGPVSGKCKGALFARQTSAPDLEVAAAKDADPTLKALALIAFRELPAHATLQKEYVATVKEAKGPWDALDGATPRVVVMRHKKLNKTLVAVTAHAGVGCDAFEAELWGVWELVVQGGKQILEPRAAPPAWQLFRPEAALDVDGDGVLELLIDGGLLQQGKDGYRAGQRLQVLNLDCHC